MLDSLYLNDDQSHNDRVTNTDNAKQNSGQSTHARASRRVDELSSREDDETEVAELDDTQQAVHKSVTQGLANVIAVLGFPNDDGDQKTNEHGTSSNTPPDQVLNEQVLDGRVSVGEELRYREDLTLAGSFVNVDYTRPRQPRLAKAEHNPLPVTKTYERCKNLGDLNGNKE
jgi:hypothetical protein